ncbi:hypothetical protein RvY_16978 [Ramazzottius varieornatus]|uniref:SWIM-type domain-containing protein n=1 Tax=Ramazzottius varieornatus TaxID=947166 RepID=A0A1D1W0H9_RAMVA|nr:hypothetical protein RvY_16978 [Ramazzottius varieornatus]
MGFSRDLPNTNLSEAMNKTLRAFFGTHNDPREVVERLLKMYADETVFMFQALKDQGRYRIAEQYREDLLLSRQKAHDNTHIMSKVQRLSSKCNVNTMVVVASSRKVSTSGVVASRPVVLVRFVGEDAALSAVGVAKAYAGRAAALCAGEVLLVRLIVEQVDSSGDGSRPSNVLTDFATTGLPDMFRVSWDKAVELMGGPADEGWMVELSAEETTHYKRKWNSSVVRKVRSTDKKKPCWYFVEIRTTSGEGKCGCLQFTQNKDPACKHIIAVTAATGNLVQMVEWLKLEKNLRPSGSWLVRSVGGHKVGRKMKNLSGSGYTTCKGKEAVEMNFEEEGYCYKSESCKIGQPP